MQVKACKFCSWTAWKLLEKLHVLEWILFAGSKKRIRTLLGSIKHHKTTKNTLRSEHAFQNVRFAFCVVNVLRCPHVLVRKKMEDTIIYSIKLDINFINLQTWRWRVTTTWDRAVYSWWGYLTDKLLTFVEHFCLSLRKIKLSIHGLLMPCSAVVGDANIKGNIKGLLSPFCWLYRWLDNPNLNVW